jgi:HEPN domain-containing protein
MMTKEEHITYWLTNAERDWIRMERCFRDKDYVFCLFCVHLSMEKICKALWLKDNEGSIPPKTHNLVVLIEATTIKLDKDDLLFLRELNKFQLEGRYPDYKDSIYKICNKIFTNEVLKKAKKLKLCLIEKLQLQ